MAKSETVPSIVVHSGNVNGGGSSGEMEQRQTNRLSRLAKQEEFDLEENYSPSPVTIHIEDGGSGTDDNSESNCNWAEGDQLDLEDSDSELSHAIQDSSTNGMEYVSGGSRKAEKGPRSHSQPKSSNKHQQLGKQGSSQGSVDDCSPTLSRDSSTETYTDSTGIDLQLFITETLHKSQKDRIMLLKIEQEMVTLVKDSKCQSYKFPHMSSYNRMLVHRVAAFFGLDHNVDKNGTSVIVNKTKNTRLPDIKFKEQIRDELVPDEPKKLILKRDSASFEDGKEKSPERQSSTDSRRSKSFEEREEEYEKARRRIFNKDEGYIESPFSRSQDGTLSSSRRSSQEDLRWAGEPRPWSSTDSDSSGWKAGGSFESEGATQNGGKNFSIMSKSDSEAKETLLPTSGARPAVTKASSFGGISVLSRENGKSSQRLTKAESFNATPTCTSAKEEANDASESPASRAASPGVVNDHCPAPVVQESPPVPLATPPSVQPGQLSEQPLPVQSPPQQVSSQPMSWEASGKEVSKNPPVNGKSPPLFQVSMVESLPPGSVIINPSSASYFASDNGTYRNKSVVTTPTQAFMVTPLQSFTASPQLSMPLDSPSTNPSPPSAQQPSPGTYHAAPAVVYIPCVASQQVPAILTHQPQVQALAMQQQQQQQQQQHASTQQAACLLEQRAVNQNGNVTADLATHLASLNLLPQGVATTSIQQTMTPSLEMAKVPISQAYAFSTAVKVPSYVNQAAPQQVPVYYLQQVPPGTQTVRYICPSVISTTPTVDLKKQEVYGEPRTQQIAQQISSNISGQHLLPPGYSLVTFAQNVDNLSLSAMPYFSYAVPSQPGGSTNPVSAYPSQLMHPGNFNSSPLLSHPPPASSHLPANFANQQQQHQQQPSIYNAFRPQTPPSSCSPHGPPPFLSYFYSPTQVPSGGGIGMQQTQQLQPAAAQFAPSFVTGGFQVIRPNIPTMKNATPPPPSPGIIPTQYPTSPPPMPGPPHGKGHYLLQLGKDPDPSAMDARNFGAGACSNHHDQKCPRIPSIHLGPPPVRVPTALPMYRHGLSVMHDVRLLGHPLHHQLSPLLLPQQRPLCRYPHPSAALAQMGLAQHQQRVPKLRRQRSKGSSGTGGAGASKNSSLGNHVLEVDGLPEGMKRSDIERYLELVTHHGAKIQFHGTDGSVAQGDFVVNSCRYRVVAVFETETAAQSALLNIKTTKFQLRSALRGGFAKSIS